MISSRPGEVTSANAARTRSSSSVAGAEGLDRGERDGGVLGLVGAVERQEDVVVRAREALERDDLAADGGRAGDDAELHALAGHGRADLGGPLEQHGGDLGGLLGEHGDRAGLDDPGLLDRDRGRVVAEVLLVVDRDRQHDGDVGVDHVGRVPAPPIPTSTTATSTGRVGEGGVGHPDDRLEEAQRVLLLGVDEVRVGRDVVERADEGLVVERLAVDADPLAHPLEVRGGEAAGAQVERAQQRLDHPARAGLAVGAGQVDRRGTSAAARRAAR